MTQIRESQAPVSLNTLRATLEQAERQATRLDASNVEAYLLLLDQIERTFEAFSQEKKAIRSEEGRWAGLQMRLQESPGVLVAAVARAGGFAKLRAQHPPATGFWWHLDTKMAGQRNQTMKRVGIAGLSIVVVALVWWGISFFMPHSTEIGSLSSTTTTVEQFVRDQQWPEALAVVESARETWPDEPELLVWEAVLAEQMGNPQVETLLATAQAQLADDPVTFWRLIGNARLQAGNLAGAEAAAQQALTLAPQDAQITLLLGSVSEARGDMAQAAAYFSQTVTLAEESNPELSVIAKMRMGNMTQSVDPFSNAPPTQTITQTLTP